MVWRFRFCGHRWWDEIRGSLGDAVQRAHPEHGLPMDNQDLTDVVGCKLHIHPRVDTVTAEGSCDVVPVSWLCPGQLLPSVVCFDIDQSTSSLHVGMKVALRKCFFI